MRKPARKPTNRSRLTQGAINYALADSSDPFTFARAMTHVGNGIASLGSKDGDDNCYSAEPAKEKRELPNGEQYEVTIYRTMRRP